MDEVLKIALAEPMPGRDRRRGPEAVEVDAPDDTITH